LRDRAAKQQALLDSGCDTFILSIFLDQPSPMRHYPYHLPSEKLRDT